MPIENSLSYRFFGLLINFVNCYEPNCLELIRPEYFLCTQSSVLLLWQPLGSLKLFIWVRTWKCACVCLCCPARWGETTGKIDAACAPFSAKTVIMACHYAAQNKGEPCSSRRAGDVLLPLFTPQLITILLDTLQTARRQPSHVCVHEMEGREGRVCVCVRQRDRKANCEGVNARTLLICPRFTASSLRKNRGLSPL